MTTQIYTSSTIRVETNETVDAEVWPEGSLEVLSQIEVDQLRNHHASWFDDRVFQILENAGVALCVSEGETLDTPRKATSDFCYLRLRKKEYSDAELAGWREWIGEQASAGRDVFAYLKHDEEGASPEYVLRLLAGAQLA